MYAQDVVVYIGVF